MNEIAIMASRIRTSVLQKIFINCNGPKPSNNPDTIAAKKQPVPVAESQLKSYRAASGVGFATTGAGNGVVQVRHIPPRRTATDFAICKHHAKSRCGGLIHD